MGLSDSRRKTLFVVLFVICLSISVLAVQLEAVTPETVDFIVFSDVHIGRALGSDGLTSYERYSMLLGVVNQYKATFMVNCGDLTDGWEYSNLYQTSMYKNYLRLSKHASSYMINAKGNHDANNTAYWSLIGSTTTMDKYGDILAVTIGCLANSGVEWMTFGTTYAQYQAIAINRSIYSWGWNHTKYHFLFMHFEPNSAWNTFSVPSIITQYCRYFDIVFCGHEGGKASYLLQQNATVIHAAHLGDGTLTTDTFLTVKIDTSTRRIAVASVNFVNGAITPLYLS